MRIHTDHIVRQTIANAATHARVHVDLIEHGSRSRDHAFEVHLTGASNRRPNSGKYGADSDVYAATWDQWGVFLAYLFDVDPNMVAGTAKHPTYGGRDDFNDRTHDRFVARVGADDATGTRFTFWPEDHHGDHSWNGWACRKCSARRF